jgi:hypothetical protein
MKPSWLPIVLGLALSVSACDKRGALPLPHVGAGEAKKEDAKAPGAAASANPERASPAPR